MLKILTIIHNNKTVNVECLTPSNIKLYAVPTSYSEDGYAVSVWSAGELEEVPGSAGVDTMLLAHYKIDQDGGVATVYEATVVSHA